MKIKPEHYATLLQALSKFYQKAQEEESKYKLKGLTPMRMRWDLLYASKLKIGDGVGTSGLPLYAYMDDTHIDTALKTCCRELGLNWAAS